ncbi:MAG: hypothetical protein R3B90_15145 [Planctomycetaceae bacterium]
MQRPPAEMGAINQPTRPQETAPPVAQRRTIQGHEVPDLRTTVSVACIIFACCALHSLIRAPVPAVGEPHYLGKAKFWWDSDWCARDFFLQSSNPHLVFYATVGWLTRLLSLEATAYVGRAIGLLVLAWGWARCGIRITGRGSTAILSAAAFCLLSAIGNFSGEWVIGGIEGKVFSYGLLLWSAALLLEHRPRPAAALAGGAISHPVVGIWYVVSVGFALLCRQLRSAAGSAVNVTPLQCHEVPLPDAADVSTTVTTRTRGSIVPPTRKDWLASVVLFLLGALPGLIPALMLVLGGDPELGRRADRILIEHRLGHHLDPLLFPRFAYQHYAGLLLGSIVLSIILAKHAGVRAARRAVVGAGC